VIAAADLNSGVCFSRDGKGNWIVAAPSGAAGRHGLHRGAASVHQVLFTLAPERLFVRRPRIGKGIRAEA
jgi:hypothetical protein